MGLFKRAPWGEKVQKAYDTFRDEAKDLLFPDGIREADDIAAAIADRCGQNRDKCNARQCEEFLNIYAEVMAAKVVSNKSRDTIVSILMTKYEKLIRSNAMADKVINYCEEKIEEHRPVEEPAPAPVEEVAEEPIEDTEETEEESVEEAVEETAEEVEEEPMAEADEDAAEETGTEPAVAEPEEMTEEAETAPVEETEEDAAEAAEAEAASVEPETEAGEEPEEESVEEEITEIPEENTEEIEAEPVFAEPVAEPEEEVAEETTEEVEAEPVEELAEEETVEETSVEEESAEAPEVTAVEEVEPEEEIELDLSSFEDIDVKESIAEATAKETDPVVQAIRKAGKKLIAKSGLDGKGRERMAAEMKSTRKSIIKGALKEFGDNPADAVKAAYCGAMAATEAYKVDSMVFAESDKNAWKLLKKDLGMVPELLISRVSEDKESVELIKSLLKKTGAKDGWDTMNEESRKTVLKIACNLGYRKAAK